MRHLTPHTTPDKIQLIQVLTIRIYAAFLGHLLVFTKFPRLYLACSFDSAYLLANFDKEKAFPNSGEGSRIQNLLNHCTTVHSSLEVQKHTALQRNGGFWPFLGK